MSDTSTFPLGTQAALRVWRLLGGLVLISAVSSAVYHVSNWLCTLDSAIAWLRLAGALPFLALSLTGGLALWHGQRRGCWLIGAAAILSFLQWPCSYIPFANDWYHQSVCMPFNALLVLGAMVFYRLVPSVPDRPGIVRWQLRAAFVVLGILAILIAKLFLLHQYNLKASMLVHRGNDAYEAGRPEEAIAIWNQAIDQYPETIGWGMALFNTGLAYQEQGRWAEAIPVLEKLLASKLNDTDPSPYLMAAYQNYHHRACMGLANCHEQLGDLKVALGYAKLARDVYPYRSWCITCKASASASLKQKIARLESKVPKGDDRE